MTISKFWTDLKPGDFIAKEQLGGTVREVVHTSTHNSRNAELGGCGGSDTMTFCGDLVGVVSLVGDEGVDHQLFINCGTHVEVTPFEPPVGDRHDDGVECRFCDGDGTTPGSDQRCVPCQGFGWFNK